MFCSFLDGTKSAVEMAAVANATGLVPQGGDWPSRPAVRASSPRSCDRPPTVACSIAAARSRSSPACTRRLARRRTTCAGASTSRSPPADRFVAGAFAAYGVATSRDGRVAALWRPSHLVGLELGTSVARAVLAGEPTGAPRAAIAEVACRAKRDLRAGEMIDGEGGEHVFGVLRGAAGRTADDVLPMGLARGARLLRAVARGAEVTRADVEFPATGAAGQLYAELMQEREPSGSSHLS